MSVITSIKINGFLTFVNTDKENNTNSINISLNNKINILVGDNGTGKTSLLKLIYIAVNNKNKLNEYVNENCENNFIEIEFELCNDKEFMNDLLKFSIIKKIIHRNMLHTVDKTLYDDFISNIKMFCKTIYAEKIIYKCYLDKYNKVNTNLHIMFKNIADNSTFIWDINDELNCKNCDVCKFLTFPSQKKEIYSEHMQANVFISTMLTPFINNNIIKNNINEQKMIKVVKMYNNSQADKSNAGLEGNIDLFQTLMHYIKSLLLYTQNDKCCPINELISISKNLNTNEEVLYETIEKINYKYRCRRNLFILKNNGSIKYNQIKEAFHEIMKCEFEVVVDDTTQLYRTYAYKVIHNGKYYNPSCGQEELINVLELYFNNTGSTNIILIDEPCTHLSPEKKIAFRDYISLKNTNNQLLIVTHDAELISEKFADNILHFTLVNGITKINDLQSLKLDIERKTELFRNKQVLFSSRVFLTEGPTDYKYVTCIFESINNNSYLIVPCGSVTAKLWETLDRLGIKWKTLYDCDKVYEKKDKQPVNYNALNRGRINAMQLLMNIVDEYLESKQKISDINIFLKYILNKSDNKIWIWYKDLEAFQIHLFDDKSLTKKLGKQKTHKEIIDAIKILLNKNDPLILKFIKFIEN
jgi:predicted ATP-dependent endonuclease of OLD family